MDTLAGTERTSVLFPRTALTSRRLRRALAEEERSFRREHTPSLQEGTYIRDLKFTLMLCHNNTIIDLYILHIICCKTTLLTTTQ